MNARPERPARRVPSVAERRRRLVLAWLVLLGPSLLIWLGVIALCWAWLPP